MPTTTDLSPACLHDPAMRDVLRELIASENPVREGELNLRLHQGYWTWFSGNQPVISCVSRERALEVFA